MAGSNEMIPSEVHQAASRLGAAATGVRGHVPVEVKQVSGALPGSTSDGAASALSATWEKRFNDWAKRADTQVTSMNNAATAREKLDAETASTGKKHAAAVQGAGGGR